MLLAQASPAVGMPLGLMIGLAAAAAGLALVVFVLVLSFRYAHYSRQMLHAERMRSLEAGIPLESSDAAKAQEKVRHNAFWIAFWLVFSVPTAAFSAASAATRELNPGVALGIIIWLGASAAGIVAVVCATVLMLHTRSGKLDDVIAKPLKLL